MNINIEELKERKGHPMGLYDSDTNFSLYVEHAIAVVVSQNGGPKKALLYDYCTTIKGRLCKISEIDAEPLPNIVIYKSVHYHIEGDIVDDLAQDVVFKRFANIIGLDGVKLAESVLRWGRLVYALALFQK